MFVLRVRDLGVAPAIAVENQHSVVGPRIAFRTAARAVRRVGVVGVHRVDPLVERQTFRCRHMPNIGRGGTQDDTSRSVISCAVIGEMATSGSIPTAKRVSQSALWSLKESLASIYWYKSDLESFLRATVSRPEVLVRLSFNEPKRRIVGELVDRLAADQDRYLGDLLELMREVTAFEDFAHLARLEDGTVKVARAREAVADLRKHYEGHAAVVAEREAAAERLRRARETGAQLQGDRQRLDELKAETIALLSADEQPRGYGLEKLLRELFELFDLDPKASFKIAGEQIDGAFTFDGIDYLLEARWQKELVEPAALDAFDGKIRRKLENTLGLFVAMNGFSETGVRNHSRLRPTMILMEGGDLWAVLEGRMPLPDLLRRKRRHAAQTGEILLRVSDF